MNNTSMKSSVLKTSAVLTTLVLAISLQACVITTDDSTLTIDNRSDYAIYEVNVAPIDSTFWGPNLLRGDILYPGDSLDVYDLDCDYYDVRIVDELGAECELYDVDVCFDSAYWVIDNALLSTCPIFQ